jgi:hypothetical protein
VLPGSVRIPRRLGHTGLGGMCRLYAGAGATGDRACSCRWSAVRSSTGVRSAGDRPGAGWRGYARRRAPGPGDRARGQVQRDPGTRGVDRVAHGDRATVDVDVLVGDVQITHRLQRDRRERLVDLDRSTSAGVLPSRPNALRIALAGWHSSDGSGPATTPCLPISHPGSAVVFATADYHRPSTASGGGIGSGSPVNSSTSSPLIPVRQDAVELSFPL